MTVNISAVVPISPSVARRFYEAVIFLHALIKVNFKNHTTTEPDLDTATGKSPKDEFFCFVNKLGQICDSERGGNTITAFAVLQPGSIQYRFASNSRSNAQLKIVKAYITDILTTLGQTADDKLEGIREKILGKVMVFNRPRLQYYITHLLDEMDFCIDVCDNEDTYAAQTAARNLETIKQLAEPAANEKSTDDEFAAATINLLNTIATLYNTPFETFTRQKSRQDSDPTTRTPWSELRHHLGRLQSYSIAITVLISIRRHRPALFEDFSVVYIHSIPPMDDFTPNIRRSADGIMKRMPANIQAAYRPCSAYLQSLEIDKLISKAARPREFEPIVHCEVNLLDSILRENIASMSQSAFGDAAVCVSGEEVRFYGEATWGRYIGCSKPTCRLCALYFAGHPTEVKVRPSHSNLYYKWRAPDIFEGGGGPGSQEVARKQREEILEGMIKGVRNVVFEALSLGVGGLVGRKVHDSLTTPSNPYPIVAETMMAVGRSGYGGRGGDGNGSVFGDVDADDLAERLGDMGI